MQIVGHMRPAPDTGIHDWRYASLVRLAGMGIGSFRQAPAISIGLGQQVGRLTKFLDLRQDHPWHHHAPRRRHLDADQPPLA